MLYRPQDPPQHAREDLPTRGPLESYLGPGSDTVAEFVEWRKLAEARTAACMKQHGFEYFPEVPAASDIQMLDGPEWGSREFVEKYGYGAWTEVTNPAGAFSYAEPSSAEGRAYRSSLSPTAREEYDTALRGEVLSERAGTVHRAGGGCADIGDDGLSPEQKYLVSVRDEARDFLETLPLDPAFAELDAEWSECIAGQGMTYRSPSQAQEAFMTEAMDYIENGDHGGVDPFATPHAEERAGHERRVALADLECRETLDYDTRRTAIAHELQARYVAEHQADLDLLAEALAP